MTDYTPKEHKCNALRPVPVEACLACWNERVMLLQSVLNQALGLLEPVAKHLGPAEREAFEKLMQEAPELLPELESNG